MAFISCYLTRNNKTKNTTPTVQLLEHRHLPELSTPIARIVNNRLVTTKETSTTTDDNENSNDYHESFNRTKENNFETKTNHLILSEGYLEFYHPDAESGLIRPLSIGKNMSQRYTKYISSHNQFL